MAKVYSELDERLTDFIASQHLFFVGTAPSGESGHVNVSPKGLDSFHILGPRRVAYVDFVGSGVETIAHLRQNGRIVVMFCAFEGPPKIVRLHGRGRVVEPGDAALVELEHLLGPGPPFRSIIIVDLERISDSCGYGVPLYEYKGERTQLEAWSSRKGEAGLHEYQKRYNARSIDGLKGLEWACD